MGEFSYLPLIEDMTWSYSRVSSFFDCPYKFFMRYLAGLKEDDCFYATYGSFIHKLIERYYNGEISKDDMATEYCTNFYDEVRGIRPKPNVVENYFNAGFDYLAGFEPFPFNMVAVEKRINFDVDGIPFVGIIDYIGEKDGELYIVDNKSRALKPRSNRKKPTAKDKELDKMLRQLYLYAAAVKQEYGKFPAALCFNCFRNGEFIVEPFNEDAYNEAISWVKNEIESIKRCKEFYAQRDFYYCRYLCGLSDQCVFDELARAERRGGSYG